MKKTLCMLCSAALVLSLAMVGARARAFAATPEDKAATVTVR